MYTCIKLIVFVFCRQCFSFTYNKIIVTVLFSFTHREYLIKKDSRTSELDITVFLLFCSWFSLSFRTLLIGTAFSSFSISLVL